MSAPLHDTNLPYSGDRRVARQMRQALALCQQLRLLAGETSALSSASRFAELDAGGAPALG
jgi:hypothetical protein